MILLPLGRDKVNLWLGPVSGPRFEEVVSCALEFVTATRYGIGPCNIQVAFCTKVPIRLPDLLSDLRARVELGSGRCGTVMNRYRLMSLETSHVRLGLFRIWSLPCDIESNLDARRVLQTVPRFYRR